VPAVSVTATGGHASAPVAVTVTLPADATGDVVLKEGVTTLASAAASRGTAAFTLAGLSPGQHALVASYAGDANHEAASGVVRITVTAATSPAPGTADEPARGIAKVRWGNKPTAHTRGTAIVVVSSLAAGRAKVVLRTAKGTKVKALSVRIKNGKVRARLPRLAKGRYVLVVNVPGNDAVRKAKVTRTFRVK
jgi:hypothetical protein